ncbi:MAG TPA: LacI family DNA-binding transcriptional regulator [Roseiarcus sp.]|nr:LacI family DNA-binding transcriptional regulator [Roseiarcus sp.]
MKDIARHAGVSPATVSLVLRNSPLVAKETRAGVQSSIESLGYIYHRAAANLRTRLTHTVGLVICEITNPFYAELAAGVDDVLDLAGWVAFVANTAESSERQRRFIARMREHRVDGILLAPAEGTAPAAIGELRRQGLPVVQMLRRVGQRSADYVSADFRLGMALAAEHLIHLGHRRIAFIGGGRRVTPARDRIEAFREILPRCGLRVGPIVKCMPTREGGADAIDKLFRTRANAPTAVLCHNDLCALGAMLGLADRGLIPGRDVAVIGFDNIPEASMHRPALTTVAIGAREIGEEAARLLLRRIESPDGSPERIILPPKLIIRSSCGGGAPQ